MSNEIIAPQRKITRRDFLKAAGLGTVSIGLAACGLQNPNISPSAMPSSSAGPDKTQNPTFEPTAGPTRAPETAKPLNGEFPKTRDEVVSALGGNINPDFVMKGYSDGKENGTWQIEAFPLRDGVHADANGNYIDGNGNILTNASKVYNFSETPLWITDVTLNTDNAYLFARTGGKTPAGQENSKNTSRFVGTKGARITAPLEQLALIPSNDCVPSTAAFRDGANNFTWNKDAQNGTVKIEWYNPNTQKFEQLDGRTLIALARAGKDLSVVSRMPENYPLTPDQAAKATGGTTRAEQWFIDPKSGTWTYEGFGLNNGVRFDSNNGVFKDANGRVVTDPSKIFNFADYNVNNWPTTMKASGGKDQYTFIRTGNNSQDQANTSWYVRDGLVVTLNGHGFEQAAIIIVYNPGCTSEESVKAAMAEDARGAASRDPKIKVLLQP